MLIQDSQDVLNDLVLRLRQDIGDGHAVSGIRAGGLFLRNSVTMSKRPCFVHKPLRSNSSTMAAISHMFEMIASSRTYFDVEGDRAHNSFIRSKNKEHRDLAGAVL